MQKNKRRETVKRVIDGDTIQTTSRTKSIRLANVDAPERGTPGAKKATEALKALVLGKKITVNTVARDKYQRAVAEVAIDGKSVNNAMRRKLK